MTKNINCFAYSNFEAEILIVTVIEFSVLHKHHLTLIRNYRVYMYMQLEVIKTHFISCIKKSIKYE